jgi:hypothetical protein
MAKLILGTGGMQRLIWLASLVVLPWACASQEPQQAATAWEGQPLDAVVAAWGPPAWQQTYEGKLYYGWKWQGEGSGVITRPDLPSATAPVRGQGQHTSRTKAACERVAQVDGTQVVRQVTFHGDGCERFARPPS